MFTRVGGFILMDNFLGLASLSVPVDASSLPWSEETRPPSFTSGSMFPVTAESSWAEQAKAYHEYRKVLTPKFILTHRKYALGLCNLLRSMPAGLPSPIDGHIGSLGIVEKMLASEKGNSERGIRVNQVSGGLEMANRQCGCHVWTFQNDLCLNLVYNQVFYEKATMNAFVGSVKDLLLQGLSI